MYANELDALYHRLNKIGIKLKLSSNYPWIYIDSVNNNKIKYGDRFYSRSEYTVALHDQNCTVNIIDLSKTFKIIRKYK